MQVRIWKPCVNGSDLQTLFVTPLSSRHCWLFAVVTAPVLETVGAVFSFQYTFCTIAN